jgi:hypothetical protein
MNLGKELLLRVAGLCRAGTNGAPFVRVGRIAELIEQVENGPFLVQHRKREKP